MRSLLATLLVSLMWLPASVAGIGTVTISSITETETLHAGTFTGTYPRVSGIGDPDVQSHLNALFSEWNQEALRMTETVCAAEDPGDRPDPAIHGELYCETTRNQNGLVSIKAVTKIRKGDTLIKQQQESITFFSANGQKCSLDRLFLPRVNVADCIRRIGQMQETKASGVLEQLPDDVSRQEYYLTDTALVLWRSEEDGTITESALPLEALKPYLAFSV